MAMEKGNKDKFLTLFVYHYYFMGNPQGLYGRILIVASKLKEADELVEKEDNDLADKSKHGTGYKCVQEIVLDGNRNLNLEIK